MRPVRAISATVIVALALSACSRLAAPGSSPSVTASQSASCGTTSTSFTLDTFPRIDGSTSTQPLGLAFKEAFTGANLSVDDLPFAKTDQAYHNLIDGTADLILVTSPSTDELAAAQAAGVELEVIPVVDEGFVFITNASNPVTDLTVDQLRDIYSGKTTNWSQLGGPDSPIVAYQRTPNSGSQTGMLDLVMRGTPMMDAPQSVIDTMNGLVDVVAGYDNGTGALGYSYYYYVASMYGDLAHGNIDQGVKLVSVNGVAPTDATIQSGQYPLTSAYYIVINKAAPADSPARRLAEAMTSPAGQAVAQQAGYVPTCLAPTGAPSTYTPPTSSALSLASATEPYPVHRVRVTGSDETVAGNDVGRLTVSGLADQQVADAINTRFRALQDSYLAQHPSTLQSSATGDAFAVPSDDGLTRSVPVAGNVLTLFSLDDSGTPVLALTVRLDTGAPISFADLFIDRADIEAILASAYRQSVILNNNRVEPADIEARVLDLLADYRRDTNPTFVLAAPDRVLVTIGSQRFTIELTNYWQSVAFYKRYRTAADDALYTAAPVATCPAFTAPLPGASGTTCHPSQK